MYLIEQSPIVDGKTTGTFDMAGLSLFGIPPEWLNDSDRLEVHGTSFKDNGADFCEFRFFKNKVMVHLKRVEGY